VVQEGVGERRWRIVEVEVVVEVVVGLEAGIAAVSHLIVREKAVVVTVIVSRLLIIQYLIIDPLDRVIEIDPLVEVTPPASPCVAYVY